MKGWEFLRKKLKILKLDIIYSEMTCSLSKTPLNKIYETTENGRGGNTG